MKKLMIAAAIVCAAVVSQAAYVDWAYTASATSAALASGDIVYLIAGDTAATSWESAAAVAAAASESLTSGYTATAKGQGRNIITDTTIATPFGGTDGTKGYFVIVNAAGDKWSSTAVIDFATAGTAGASLIYDPGTQQSSPGTFALQDVATAPSNAFAAVPEPTSGLLLLLGVAGLALKRRRA